MIRAATEIAFAMADSAAGEGQPIPVSELSRCKDARGDQQHAFTFVPA